MINEITCNSNNTIELSRGELLQWLNNILKINYSKIQQMGSGAAYCQLLDLVYPGKVPMSKVNWKAKHEYEYVQNFKVLQQSFVKLNIMRHIDVERLVKCKYQDNLEMLQWFKKIHDTTVSSNKEYDPQGRRGEKQEKVEKNQKQNKIPGFPSVTPSGSVEKFHEIEKNEQKMDVSEPEIKDETKQRPKKAQIQRQSPRKVKFMGQIETNTQLRLVDLLKENQDEQKMFYLRKISQIEHLMQDWDTSKSSGDLITQIRKIILVAPETEWGIQNGEFIQSLQQKEFDADDL